VRITESADCLRGPGNLAAICGGENIRRLFKFGVFVGLRIAGQPQVHRRVDTVGAGDVANHLSACYMRTVRMAKGLVSSHGLVRVT
jgi:hypothetical protein